MANVLFERDDNILRVSLNRPTVLNAVNIQVLKELDSGLKEYSTDKSIKALMLFGQGGCFAAGADIKEITDFDEEGIRSFHKLREGAFYLLENFHCPTMAVVQRYALGTGLELALCCDFRIAGEDAQLGVPSALLGMVESYTYTTRVVRAIGPYQAKKLMFTGERVDARTAFTIGLVEEITAPDKLFDRAEYLLALFSRNSSYSMSQSKKVVDRCAQDPNLREIKDPVLPMVEAIKSEDFKEGTRAFIEKRKANFK